MPRKFPNSIFHLGEYLLKLNHEAFFKYIQHCVYYMSLKKNPTITYKFENSLTKMTAQVLRRLSSTIRRLNKQQQEFTAATF